MRLIDADATIKYLREYRCKDCDRRKGMKNGKIRFCYEIGDAPCRACDIGDTIDYFLDDGISPTIDAVPVVRCKDCKHSICYYDDGYHSNTQMYCDNKSGDFLVADTWFCADGEPKAEPKAEPAKTVTPEFSGGGSVWWIQCSECGYMLHSTQMICPGCHNKINWEGWN